MKRRRSRWSRRSAGWLLGAGAVGRAGYRRHDLRCLRHAHREGAEPDRRRRGVENLAAESARIRFAPGAVDAARLVQAVEKAGFTARVADDRSREEEKARKLAVLSRRTRPLPDRCSADLAAGGADAVDVRWRDGERWGAWFRPASALAAIAAGDAGPVLDRLAILCRRLEGCAAAAGAVPTWTSSSRWATMAWALSAAVTLLGLEHEHVYFEASAAVITLVLMGKLLEARAKAGTTAAIEALVRLQPKTARIERDGGLIDVAADSLLPGDVFIVRPGESLPVDGVVLDGASSVNEAMLTGESMPVGKAAGDTVFAATQNELGQLRCRATGVGEHTLLAGIIRLVAEAQGSKAPVQRLADQVSRRSCAERLRDRRAHLRRLAAGWRRRHDGAGSMPSPCSSSPARARSDWRRRRRSWLVPGGARAGILVKNAEALERAEHIRVLAVDKTGTLTQGPR